MGANTPADDVALKRASKIPHVCKLYLSHHIRNELAAILIVAELGLKKDSKLYEVIKKSINHIITDISKLGI